MHLLVSTQLDIHYVLRATMFRSEWLKDAKFKSLVANDRSDWCLKDRKAETESALSRLEQSDSNTVLTMALVQNCDFFLDE